MSGKISGRIADALLPDFFSALTVLSSSTAVIAHGAEITYAVDEEQLRETPYWFSETLLKTPPFGIKAAALSSGNKVT